MDVVFDWNLGNMIYNGHNTLRLCGFPLQKLGRFKHCPEAMGQGIAFDDEWPGEVWRRQD